MLSFPCCLASISVIKSHLSALFFMHLVQNWGASPVPLMCSNVIVFEAKWQASSFRHTVIASHQNTTWFLTVTQKQLNPLAGVCERGDSSWPVKI